MDRNLAVAKRSQLLLIVVYKNDLVPQVGETGPGHQPHISRTYDSNANRHVSLGNWFIGIGRGGLGDVNGFYPTVGILRYDPNWCTAKHLDFRAPFPSRDSVPMQPDCRNNLKPRESGLIMASRGS